MAFWGGVVFLAVAALWLLRDSLLPFVAAFIIAYLLEPLVRSLERRRLPRWLAVTLVLGTAAAFVAMILMIVAPPLARQIGAFVRSLPDYAARLQAVAAEVADWLSSRAPGLGRLGLGDVPGDPGRPSPDVVGQAVSWFGGVLASLASGGQAVIGALSLFIVAPIVAFYLLIDWNRMIAAVDRWLPRADAPAIRDMAREIDAVIGRYLRGQALVCLFLAAWYGFGLLLVGLNFGFLIGATSGLLSFIPYVGSVVGFLVASAVGVVQFWPNIGSIALVFLVFGVGQFLESYIVTPKIVGEATGLHPVWIMFALFAFGGLFGFAGLILAVPLAAAIGVLIRHGLRAYLASPLYAAEPPDAGR